MKYWNRKSVPRNERSRCHSPQLLPEHCCPGFLSSTDTILTAVCSLTLQIVVILMIELILLLSSRAGAHFPWTDKPRRDLDYSTNSKSSQMCMFGESLCARAIVVLKKLSYLCFVLPRRAHCEAERHDPEHFRAGSGLLASGVSGKQTGLWHHKATVDTVAQNAETISGDKLA